MKHNAIAYRSLLIATAYLSLLLLSTCGKDSPTQPQTPEPTPPPPPPTPVATRIEISPSSPKLNSIGQAVQLTAMVYDQNNAQMSSAVVNWTSSAVGVATVSNQGLVTAVANGTASITVQSGSASASVPVTVMQSAGSIVIEPSSATLMSIGETVQLTATVLDGNGRPVDDVVVTWSSSDVSVATVSGAGLVTAVGNGSVAITAGSGSASTSVPVTVMQSAGSIAVEPDEATLMALGETVQLTATVLDGNGQPVSGAVVTWLSSDVSVATVSDQGLVTAVSNGSVTITARSGSASASVPVTVKDSSRDRDVLVTLYNATDGPNWTNNNNWLSTRPLGEWYGVTTDSNGRVTRLNINVNNLRGSIPSELSQLRNLTWLRLRYNDLTGPIPPSIGQLDNLVRLELGSNQLTGPIPSELSQLRHLEKLELWANRLTGSIPPELGRLVSLDALTLGSNQLTGSVPPELGQLVNLRSLNLWVNQLTGSIPPELGQLVNLRGLELNTNQLSGSIPATLGNLTNLRLLRLNNNSALSGSLPSSFTNLTNLDTLTMDGTSLCAPTDAVFQAWLRGIANKSDIVNCALEPDDRFALVALYNATGGPNWTNSRYWMGDAPLGAWHGVTTDDEGKVTALELNENNLRGTLPPELGQLSKLESLIFAANPLTGGIPPELGQLVDLKELVFAGSELTGSIPSELGQLQKLETLQLHYNQLSGSIPSELGQLGALKELYLAHNRLTGGIPSELGELSKLKTLALNNNPGLSGPLPVELTRLTNLTGILLQDTQLCVEHTPEFLAWLRQIGETASSIAACTTPDRKALIALYNGLNGPNWTNRTNWLSNAPLDAWHGVQINAFGEVTSLDLSRNNLQGTIPPELVRLQSLAYLNLSSNRITGAIPSALGGKIRLRFLDLSNNQFTGVIPSTFGQVPNLRFLDLSSNRLRGAIPSTLGQLGRLVYLEIGNNQLTGAIPSEIGQLSNLAGLVLSNNRLTGAVPSELGQLSRLEELSLDHNAGLSGSLAVEMTKLVNLTSLSLDATGICVPFKDEFLAWLGEIEELSGFIGCSDSDRDVLIALYQGTSGSNWNIDTHWPSDRPIGEWFGVTTSEFGPVTELELAGNNLQGSIPSELGQLVYVGELDFANNQLTGSIPSELGQLENLTRLNLSANQLTGTIPAELGQLENLTRLNLSANQLTGTIPIGLERLENLTHLSLSANQLSGAIPIELGQLTKLEGLYLHGNPRLSGQLPVELTRLENLSELYFDAGICVPATEEFQTWFNRIPNRSTGTLNCEDREALIALYNSTNGPNWINSWKTNEPMESWHGVETNTSGAVTGLNLTSNNLQGHIPSEIGQIGNLTNLILRNNKLSGSIPAEIGQLSRLSVVDLGNNGLDGSIPSGLGQIASLFVLDVRQNKLTGRLPPGFGELTALRLAGNRMIGALPRQVLINRNLQILEIADTALCVPQDDDGVSLFERWWAGGIETDFNIPVPACHSRFGKSAAFLTQAVYRGVLEAGEKALLRVFVTTLDEPFLGRPDIRATFYVDNVELYSLYIPAKSTVVHNIALEHELEASANAVVPGWVVRPGLEMVIDIDLDSQLDPAIRIPRRLPPTGRLAVNVRNMPPLTITIVPLYWEEDPGPDKTNHHNIVNHVTPEHRLFRYTRDLLPVGELELRVAKPVWTPKEPVFENRNKMINLTRKAAFSDNYQGGVYMGVLRDSGGAAPLGEAIFVSGLNNSTIAHELGHTMNLHHAPCGNPKRVDPGYPYPDGSIGSMGYDIIRNELVPADTPDLMGYCDPPEWISAYHFLKAWSFRVSGSARPIATNRSPTKSLLLWGGVYDDGEIFLDPAFAVEARPVLPQTGGPYLIVGEDRNGGTLFNLSFDMSEILDGGGGIFSFVLPNPGGLAPPAVSYHPFRSRRNRDGWRSGQSPFGTLARWCHR